MNPARAVGQSSPRRATYWQLRNRRLDFAQLPRLMGIVNVTPDSFSDGGRFFDATAAVDQALRLEDAGADVLDIGGESTRPYSQPVALDEELRRVVPVVQQLAERVSIPLSIDTSKARVARDALAAGAEIINDVTALAGDPDMVSLAVESKAGVCAMHMQGTPQTMQDNPAYTDVVAEVADYLCRRRDELQAAGVETTRLALDPGIGFGKTHQHNLNLLAHVERFHELGCPLLVGHSRKGLIARVLNDKQADLTAGTIGVALSLATHGVQVIRVHDVAAVRHALLLFAATGALDGQAWQLK